MKLKIVDIEKIETSLIVVTGELIMSPNNKDVFAVYKVFFVSVISIVYLTFLLVLLLKHAYFIR